MKVLETPAALPAKCVVCGACDNNDGRKYLDFGFELDYYGVIYFCTHCFGELSTAAGYISPSLFKIVEKENLEFADKMSGLEAENVKLRVALNSLDFLGSANIYDDVGSGVESSTEESGSNGSESIESFDESGSTDVSKTGKSKKRTTADLDDFLK